LVELAVPDLGAQLFVPEIARRAQPGLSQFSQNLLPVFVELLRNRNDPHLLGREPEREVAARVLDEDTEEPFERAEDRPVEDDGTLLRSVLGRVVKVEERGKVEVALERAELPGPPDRVVNAEVDLRTVERPVAGGDDVGPPRRLQGRLDHLFRTIPD